MPDWISVLTDVSTVLFMPSGLLNIVLMIKTWNVSKIEEAKSEELIKVQSKLDKQNEKMISMLKKDKMY